MYNLKEVLKTIFLLGLGGYREEGTRIVISWAVVMYLCIRAVGQLPIITQVPGRLDFKFNFRFTFVRYVLRGRDYT